MKLTIAIASSALFNLEESDAVFRTQGDAAYRDFQEAHIDVVLEKGVAFPFIRRLLSFNDEFPQERPIEVILLSRNSPETGMRVFRSIKHYGLDITRASFFTGKSPFQYLQAFDVSLFLSAHVIDVKQAILAGYPAGYVLQSEVVDNQNDKELRLAFDFDGVLADDAAEKVYKETKDLQKFHDFETSQSLLPHNPGPLWDLMQKLSYIQKLETERKQTDSEYKQKLQISLITARCAPSHERVVTTLKSWGVQLDQAFFLGGKSKNAILEILQPHMYFDDQLLHLHENTNLPLVHIPFGVANIDK